MREKLTPTQRSKWGDLSSSLTDGQRRAIIVDCLRVLDEEREALRRAATATFGMGDYGAIEAENAGYLIKERLLPDG